MGGCASIDIYETYPDVKKFKSQFEAIHLNHNDVRKFYFVYRQMDNDNSGSIGLPELLAHIDIEVTDFSESVFSIFDKDGSGELDFREFVISTWNYCTLSRSTLEYFAYNLYDKDNSGSLNVEEIIKMLQDIYGPAFRTNAYAKQISDELVGKQEMGSVTKAEFFLFCKNHQALLFPAFEMQRALQKFTLGVGFWERLIETRVRLSNHEFIPVDKYIERFMGIGDPKIALQKLEMEKKKKAKKGDEDYSSVSSNNQSVSLDPHKPPKHNRNTDRVLPEVVQKRVGFSRDSSPHGSTVDLKALSGTSTPNTTVTRHNIPHSDFHSDHLLTKPVAHERLAHNNHAHKRIDHTAEHNQLHKVLMDKLYETTLDPIGGLRNRSSQSSPQHSPMASPRQLFIAERFDPTLPSINGTEPRKKVYNPKEPPPVRSVGGALTIPSIVDNQHAQKNKGETIIALRHHGGDTTVGKEFNYTDHHGVVIDRKNDEHERDDHRDIVLDAKKRPSRGHANHHNRR